MVQAVTPETLTLKERGGEVIELALPDKPRWPRSIPLPWPTSSPAVLWARRRCRKPTAPQLAIEIMVFPEAARGTGEGHYPWDLQPQSTMTNATVADLAAAPSSGRRLMLKYKDGEKTVIVPPTAPVVTFEPGDDEAALVVPGAKVLITAQLRDGKPTALRINAGRNGFALPY